MSGALALTIDNVRSFGRLRTIGADEERTRIARDLHDRLGQWLTYISLELERITGEVPDTTSLQSLYGDVQTAIDEALTTVGSPRPIRFRTPAETTWLRHGDAVLPAAIVKDHFGEFAVRDRSGREVEISPEWVEANIVTAELPILGTVQCHADVIEAMRTALASLVDAGLSLLCCLQPLIWTVAFVVGCVGLGAVVLTRFGTQIYPPTGYANETSAPVETPESSEATEEPSASD